MGAKVLIECEMGTNPKDIMSVNNPIGLSFSVVSKRIAWSQVEKREVVLKDWFDVALWGDNATRYRGKLAQGDKITVRGELQKYEWQSDGGKHKDVKVLASTIEFSSNLL